ncbi:unnamed protein product [Closterium sp. NIES-64]|nr:unnamed protein product [Closterium sp. NIES-64]
MASTHSDAADSQSDGSDSPILVERPGPSDVTTVGELADREAAGGAAAGGAESKADDSSAEPPCSDGAPGDPRKERAEPPERAGQDEAESAAALVSPSKAHGRERGAAGSGQGEVAAAVGQVAAGVAAGVAGLASSAGAEAAAVVSSLGERVTGLSTGFVSLFSVFDSAIAYPSDKPTAPAAAGGGSSAAQAEAHKARGGSDGRGTGGAEEEGQVGAEGSARSPHPSRAIDLQAIFGLPTHETLLEAFPCRLLQLYRPVYNTFTPDMRRAFRGMLYITHQHVCLCLDDSGRRIPIKLEAAEVAGVGKQAARRGDSSDQLKIDLSGAHTSLLLQDFASPDALDSALALLEHITS